MRKMGTTVKTTSLTILLLTSLALQSCAENKNPQLASDETKILSFLPETNETEAWTDSDKYPQTPYVMWVSTQDEVPCTVPLYHTGYQTSWTFIRNLALSSGVQEARLGKCPQISDRCYLQSTEWLGAGSEEAGFTKAKACDPELEAPKR